jgi:hypothetical protein
LPGCPAVAKKPERQPLDGEISAVEVMTAEFAPCRVLQTAGDPAEGVAEIGADQRERGNRCDGDQRRDQRIFDGRDP